MDLAKGISAFISGKEMILSLMVDTFIIVSNQRNLPGDESWRTLLSESRSCARYLPTTRYAG